jgi:TIR domain
MVGIFVAYAKEDAACTEQINQGLEAKGYTVWREPKGLSIQSISYPRTIENSILGSAAVLVVWSSHAARSEWVERQVLFAQRLKKLVVPVVLDTSELPNTLFAVSPVAAQTSCADALTQLLPLLPSPQSTDALIALIEKAAKDSLISMRSRKAAIDQAAEMLQRGEHREEVLAILEYLAGNDVMEGVRQKAQAVLNAEAKKSAPPLASLHPDDSRHMFGVRCKNGHVTYFDKRRVCSAYKEVPRAVREVAGMELDELLLKCGTCGVEFVARTDCGGYK